MWTFKLLSMNENFKIVKIMKMYLCANKNEEILCYDRFMVELEFIPRDEVRRERIFGPGIVCFSESEIDDLEGAIKDRFSDTPWGFPPLSDLKPIPIRYDNPLVNITYEDTGEVMKTGAKNSFYKVISKEGLVLGMGDSGKAEFLDNPEMKRVFPFWIESKEKFKRFIDFFWSMDKEFEGFELPEDFTFGVIPEDDMDFQGTLWPEHPLLREDDGFEDCGPDEDDEDEFYDIKIPKSSTQVDIYISYAICDAQGKVLCYDRCLDSLDFLERTDISIRHRVLSIDSHDSWEIEEGKSPKEVIEESYDDYQISHLCLDNLKFIDTRIIIIEGDRNQYYSDTQEIIPLDGEKLFQIVSDDGKILCMGSEEGTAEFVDPSKATSRTIMPFWNRSKVLAEVFLSDDPKPFEGDLSIPSSFSLQENTELDPKDSAWFEYWEREHRDWMDSVLEMKEEDNEEDEDDDEKIKEENDDKDGFLRFSEIEDRCYTIVFREDGKILCNDGVYRDFFGITSENLQTYTEDEKKDVVLEEGCKFKHVVLESEDFIYLYL